MRTRSQPLDARRRAFAEVIGRGIAGAIWREITAPDPQNATSSPTEAARGTSQGERRRAAGYAEQP